MSDDLRLLPPPELPDRLVEAEELTEEYRRLRADITGRGQSSPVHVRDALTTLGDDEVTHAVDPRSRRQARYTTEQKAEYAEYLRAHMTPAEVRLWRHLEPWKMDGLSVQPQAVLLGWVVDFYLPDVRVVIEVDGAVHQMGPQWQRDRHKDAVLQREGYTVLRFTNAEALNHTQRCLSQILNTITSMGGNDAR